MRLLYVSAWPRDSHLLPCNSVSTRMTSASDLSVVEFQGSGIYETPLSVLRLMAVQRKIPADTAPDETGVQYFVLCRRTEKSRGEFPGFLVAANVERRSWCRMPRAVIHNRGARGQRPSEHRRPLLISMEIWETFLFVFGGNAGLLLALGYLVKSLLDKRIVQDTKRFESELKAKSDAAIEHIRNTLQLQAIEHQVRFSRLHEKRASVIAELYGHLVEALWEAESFLSPMQWAGDPKMKEKYELAMNKFVELYRYFDKHRIYLPEEVCTSRKSHQERSDQSDRGRCTG